MLMHDPPFAVDLATANGGARPHIRPFVIGPYSCNSIEAVTEGYVVTRRDVEVAKLIADRTPECREPRRPVFSTRLGSLILQWGCEVEQEHIG